MTVDGLPVRKLGLPHERHVVEQLRAAGVLRESL